jgi:hypothetical protein
MKNHELSKKDFGEVFFEDFNDNDDLQTKRTPQFIRKAQVANNWVKENVTFHQDSFVIIKDVYNAYKKTPDKGEDRVLKLPRRAFSHILRRKMLPYVFKGCVNFVYKTKKSMIEGIKVKGVATKTQEETTSE